MNAVVLAFPDPRDPVGAIRRAEAETGRIAKVRGAVVVLIEPPPAAPAAAVLPFRQARDLIPAFLRPHSPSPFDPNGPRAA